MGFENQHVRKEVPNETQRFALRSPTKVSGSWLEIELFYLFHQPYEVGWLDSVLGTNTLHYFLETFYRGVASPAIRGWLVRFGFGDQHISLFF